MALYQSFTPVASGATLDRSTSSNDTYIITASGQWAAAANAIVKLGFMPKVKLEGFSNHSVMLGTIEATDPIFYMNNTQRLDFGATDTAYIIDGLCQFVCEGAGTSFLHLEDNKGTSDFRGGLLVIARKSAGGVTNVQFGNRQFDKVVIDGQNNSGGLNVYASRSHARACSFTNFTTRGLTAFTMILGDQPTSSAILYDPIFEGSTGNNIGITVVKDGGGIGAGNFFSERFSVDVSNYIGSDWRGRFLVGTTNVFENDLTSANTSGYTESDGTTPLRAYTGKNVVMLEVRKRTGATGAMGARGAISYRLRRYGYHDITVNNFALNTALKIEETQIVNESIEQVDKAIVAAYTDTNTVRRMHDATDYVLQNNFDIDKSNFILTGNDSDGWTFDLGAYDITIDANAASGLPVINGNRITYKANTVSGKLKTTGTITLSNGSTIPDGYEDATQDSEVEIIGVDISGNNTLWYSLATTAPTVETDTGWTQMATTKYKYRATDASDTSTVHFRLKKPDTDGTGAHYSKDDWKLNQKGLGLRFEKFTSEFGVIADGLKRDILAQMTTDKNSLDAQFANNGQTLQRMENTGNTTLQMAQGIAGRAHLEYSSVIEITGTGLIETQGFVGKYKKLDVVEIRRNFFSSLYNPIAGGRGVQPEVDPTRGCWVKEAATEADNIYIWYSVNQGGMMATKKDGSIASYLIMEIIPTGGEPGSYPYIEANEKKLRQPVFSISNDNAFADVPSNQYTLKIEGLQEKYLLEDNATISEVARVVQKDAKRVPEVLKVPDDPATI